MLLASSYLSMRGQLWYFLLYPCVPLHPSSYSPPAPSFLLTLFPQLLHLNCSSFLT